jgi:Fur family transcriptional regulator, ferric uptake regulator
MEEINKELNLKNAGLKVTIPRLRILNIFQTSKTRHLSAEDVYKLLLAENMDIGVATVYRVLIQFEQAGILLRNNFDHEKATFELNEGEHHDHLICINCNKVEEFFDDIIEHRQHEVASKYGFSLQAHSMSLYGICSACAIKASA